MHILRSASIISLSLTLLSMSVQAEWIEASGEAMIINGNIAQAREEAINQAVSYATLNTGIRISSEQQTTNGNLTQSSFAINRNAQAISIQLVNERIQGQRIYVSLRLDLNEDPTQQCPNGQLKAAILIPQAQIKDRTQLRYGQLSGFEEIISEKLSHNIDSYSSTSFSHLHAKERLDITQDLVDIRGYRLPNWLSEITDSNIFFSHKLLIFRQIQLNQPSSASGMKPHKDNFNSNLISTTGSVEKKYGVKVTVPLPHGSLKNKP